MSGLVVGTVGPWLVSSTDRGISASATSIRNRIGEFSRDRLASVNIGNPHRETIIGLRHAILDEATDDNGPFNVLDGETLRAALAFAWRLPSDAPAPMVNLAGKHRVHFEWRTSTDTVFVVSVGPSTVSYAGIFGRNTVNGQEEVIDELPDSILANLGRALRKSR